jgi:alpha-beta hydrolase superfamily lysophospholipase
MIRSLAITLILTLVLQVCCHNPACASVERKDLIPLGEQLGFPVYEWKDNSVPTKALIIGFHGMTFYGLALDDAATHFAAQGYPFYSFDFRGFGEWRDKNPKYKNDGKAHFSQSVEDGKRLVKALHAEYPDLKPYIKNNLATSKEVTQIYLNDPQIHNKLSSVELFKAMITNKRSVQQSELIPEDVPLLIISGEKDRIFKIRSVEDFAEVVGPEQATCKVMPGRGHLLLELHPMDTDLANTIDTWLGDQIQIKQSKAHSKEFDDQGAMNVKDTALRML